MSLAWPEFREREREAILEATRELLERIIAENDLRQEDIASAIFSTTPALTDSTVAVSVVSLPVAGLVCTTWIWRPSAFSIILAGVSRS